jgi:hypothetical protein
MDLLDEQVMAKILSCGAASDVLAYAAVSMEWQAIARSDEIWLPLASALLDGKLADSTPPSSATRLTPEALGRSPERVKELLAERLGVLPVELTRAWEQDEAVRLRYGLPWLLRLPTLHLASYFCAKADAKRTWIWERELTERRFGFCFRFVRQRETGETRIGTFAETFHATCRFHADGKFESDDVQFAHRHPRGLQWIFVDGAGARERLGVGPGYPSRAVQILPFPPLIATRTPNWGWRLENEFVVMLSDLTSVHGVDRHYGPGHHQEFTTTQEEYEAFVRQNPPVPPPQEGEEDDE